MGLAQLLRQEGRNEGRQEGRHEGRREEAARLLERMALKRFGVLPPSARSAIDAADLDTLEAWLDRALDAPPVDAIFSDAERH